MMEGNPSTMSLYRSARAPRRRGWVRALVGLLLLVLAIAGGIIWYYYRLDTQAAAAAIALAQKEATETQSEKVVRRVGELMPLPNERPTVAEITNIANLRNKPFFEHAKNGDNVLIYEEAHMVIVYDPVANSIVDVGMLNQ